MFSPSISTGTEHAQVAEMDSSSEGSSGGNATVADPAIVDESSTGMELEDLTLDVLLVSLHFDHRWSGFVDNCFPRTSNCPHTLQVYVVPPSAFL